MKNFLIALLAVRLSRYLSGSVHFFDGSDELKKVKEMFCDITGSNVEWAHKVCKDRGVPL